MRTERWHNEGGTVYDENRLIVAHVVGQDEDDSDACLIAAAPLAEVACELALQLIKDNWPEEHGSEQVGMAWGALEAFLKAAKGEDE